MAGRINQDRDEGLSGDSRELKLQELRDAVKAAIMDNAGALRWYLARDLGKAVIPSLAASTVMRFATGDTKRPDVKYTVRVLAEHLEGRRKKVLIVDADWEPPKRANAIEVE